MTKRLMLWAACAAAFTLPAATGCGGGGGDGDGGIDAGDEVDAGDDIDAGVEQGTALRASKGGSIAANDAGTLLAVANKATNDVSLFELPSMTLVTRVAVGEEPISVTWSPNGDILYVVNRASQTVSVVTQLSSKPAEKTTIEVGSEPGHAALTPNGKRLYVANWAEGTISVIDTGDNTVIDELRVGGAPHALCMTNDGDQDDDDELLFAPDFYARPIAGQAEATDRSRQGQVLRISTGDHSVKITDLTPLEVQGVDAVVDAANTAGYANQLYSCVVNGGYTYVTSVNASPDALPPGASVFGETDFHQNIHGAVYAIELSSGEVSDERTVNLSELVTGLPAPKRFVGVPSDIQCVDDSEFCYISSLNSDSVFRIDFSRNPPLGGSTGVSSFLEAGKSPTGIAIAGSTAYTYNEVGRSVTEIDLVTQTTAQLDIESAPQPSSQAEIEQLAGQKFFNTGLGRWSANGWVGCVGCHPFGTTDNVTYVFPAGPRQTVDVSASFNDGASVHRILNWTGIFDEICDFELNTRGVAGGTGAIVSDAALNDNGSPNAAARIDFVGAGGVANPTNGFNVGSACAVARTGAVPNDWDEITLYIQTLRSPRGAKAPEGDPVAGREVFEEARCQNCHGGPLWTVSERYHTPILNGDLRLLTLAEAGVSDVSGVRSDLRAVQDPATDTVIAVDANGAPHRHSCVVRKVGTFDNKGPDNRGAAELRQNDAAAQGVDGFNVPSLLGINLGAPYLHNGAAETLEDLLDPDGAFGDHLIAGNAVFSPSADDVRNLAAFLRTIDDDTPIIDVPANQDICPPTPIVPPLP
ncbi:YncE family protein [Haliangium ochraceum]|uniref:40-residue YVTN family beta-propeller repeat protein n=1 Tax=Haliangium ochraceum (strain DSM 14365 / JCM 11303 / SMP-2) TaxID=502025 RepID=D0LMK8_HALO1|nr:YncE family protein [Haliangium ochraceum]ACY18695.1 40-residue YVTN family beta-propeller repeat protein [Haliangium ochraceum DSM 14365]